MTDCPCGKPVRLRATRITVNRKSGVAHWIEHTDGSPMHEGEDWSCAMLKPYPKQESERPRAKMVERWNTTVALTTTIRIVAERRDSERKGEVDVTVMEAR